MSVSACGFSAALFSAWVAYALDWEFKKHWAEADRDMYLSLHESEAQQGNPFPYCVLVIGLDNVMDRMSDGSNSKRATVEIPVTFKTYATQTDTSDGKQLAESLTVELMKRFGGHPTETPKRLALTAGSHINTQYIKSFGIAVADLEYVCQLEYKFTLDLPYIPLADN